jgi:hypothetical protein
MINLAALIVETRKVDNLEQVIFDHMRHLPKGTDLYILTSWHNEYLSKYFPNATFRFSTRDMPVDKYNRLMTSPEFWDDFLDYDRILVFQHDSMLLRGGIEEFYPYDYVGAPWAWNPTYGGNGGLSLRNPKVMLEITERYPWNGIQNEDHWLCMHMSNFRIGSLAPLDVCKRFSCEGIFELGTLGYHAIEKWLTVEAIHKVKSQYLTLENN